MKHPIVGIVFTISIVLGALTVDMAETGVINSFWQVLGYTLIFGGMGLVGYYFFIDTFPEFVTQFKDFFNLD